MPLVDYDSSSESESESDPDPGPESYQASNRARSGHRSPRVTESAISFNLAKAPSSSRSLTVAAQYVGLKTKRKALPTLPSSFDSAHKDDPSQHQGRKRTRPFIDGEYTAHVYLHLPLPASFRRVLEELVGALPPSHCGQPIHQLFSDAQVGSVLHVSLTHPLPLRRSQITAFRDELSSKLTSSVSGGLRRSFRLSLAGRVKVYYNTLRTPAGSASEGGMKSGGRAFLALRVGAGAGELRDMLDKVIHPVLVRHHLPTYHSEPEFHTSFAWTLLESQSHSGTDHVHPAGTSHIDTSKASEADDSFLEDDGTVDSGNEVQGRDSVAMHASEPYSVDDLDRVNDHFERRILESQPASGWEVDCVHVKVAREVTVIRV